MFRLQLFTLHFSSKRIDTRKKREKDPLLLEMNKRKSAAEAFSSKHQCDTDFPITLKNSFTCYTIDSLWVPIFPGISGGKQ